MRYSALVLTCIVLLSMLVFLPNSAIYSTHPSPVIEGTVTPEGCNSIGGSILTDTTDEQHKLTIELCKFGSKYYRIYYNLDCVVEQTGAGKDPDTGKAYFFNYICDVPRLCNPPYSWGITNVRYWNQRLQVNVEGKQFGIVTGSAGAICNFESFNQEEKKLTIVSQGIKDTEGFIDVTIPNEFLSGEFKVMIDGTITEFAINMTETTKITIPIDFSQKERRIDIVGTHVIPEFPAFGLIIFGISLALILTVALTPKLNRWKMSQQ